MFKKNKQLNLNLSIVIIFGLAFFLVLLLRTLPLTKNTPFSSLSEKENSSLPVRLKIPSINVDATVDQVGLTEGGAMDAPKGPAEVAWYNLGPRPGGMGSAVIDGHSGYKDNRPAVFDNLYKLKKGDKVYVEDEMGATTTFVVREIRNYDPDADAKDVFSSSDGASHLNLITCAGDWDSKARTHSNRLVIFSDKEIP